MRHNKYFGPYIVEHDSEIVKKAKDFKVTVVFNGDNENDLNADMWIEHEASDSYEEWDIKGKFTVDDAFKLGKKTGIKPIIQYSGQMFAASLFASGTKGEKLYKEAEKYFNTRNMKKTRESKVYL